MSEHENETRSAEAPTKPDRKSGRVAFDIDGRGVWEWQTATGVFTRNVTKDQLIMLSTVELEIAETPFDDVNAKVFKESHRLVPAKTASRPSRRTARSDPKSKKEAGGVAAWLMRGWRG